MGNSLGKLVVSERGKRGDRMPSREQLKTQSSSWAFRK